MKMRTTKVHVLWSGSTMFVMAAFLIVASGCGGDTKPLPGAPISKSGNGQADAHGHDHAHPAHGPNGGHLVELGEEEYHAEWLLDGATGTVTVIILDGQVKDEVGIEAKSVTINVAIEGQSQTYELPAVNASGDDPPKATQFELSSEKLLTALKVGTGVHATLSVDIAGKQYVGQIEFHHH
jgi:hypothetical protein